MKGGDYSNQVFKQLQEVMKKCDDLSHEVKIIEKKTESLQFCFQEVNNSFGMVI